MALETAHFYEPRHGHGLAYDPFNSIIGPRPIGWISSVDGKGRRNLAPYSFFNGFNYHPPIIGFSSIGWKDSVANIKETGEFVWNLATRRLAKEMNATSAHFPRDVDEFDVAGLTAGASRVVSAPRVIESPVNFECKLTQLIRLTNVTSEAIDSWLVLGEVVGVHIDADAAPDGRFDTFGQGIILRAGRYGDYAEISPATLFEMTRPDGPSAAEAQPSKGPTTVVNQGIEGASDDQL